MTESPATPRTHILTVLLEDYFHVGAFNSIINPQQWYRFETRFEQNTLNTLDLLDRFQIKSTFFVLGWIAERQPELVREVARRGHEIASRGYLHRSIRNLTPEEFRADLRRSRAALERASETHVVGYRAPRRWSDPKDLWGLDILVEEGFYYDSSILPKNGSTKSANKHRFPHRHQHQEKEIWEIPFSTIKLGHWLFPIGGGNYFRQFPHTLVKKAVDHWHQTCDAPFVMYFHVWELDPVQPRISGASSITKIRHYRNLHKMPWILEDYLGRYKFSTAAHFLGLRCEERQRLSDSSAPALFSPSYQLTSGNNELAAAPISRRNQQKIQRIPVTIVVPCFNEEPNLPYLANTLKSVEASLEQNYAIALVFVDDSSTDDTRNGLKRLFGAKPNCHFLGHSQNEGVAAAILTGIRHAKTEIVCSIDCDCTYDPHELKNMIPLLLPGIDMVTASPYHKDGDVRNVPSWRLALSKTSSLLYRIVLRQKLYTYTSCFRVYRRSALQNLTLKEGGFLGVAEMIGELDLHGGKIIEYPTTLELRLFGCSKMRILSTIRGHLRLLMHLLARRLKIAARHDGIRVSPMKTRNLNVRQ